MIPLLTTTEMARRLGICTATLLRWRKRRGLREGLHYWQRGVGMERWVADHPRWKIDYSRAEDLF